MLRCSQSSHRAVVAMYASRGPGREAWGDRDQFIMSFHDKKYEVFVILGDAAEEPAWTEPRWKLISEILDPLVQQARGRAAVRSTQMRRGPGSPNQRSVSFGRIGWNAQGHKKWVHQSPASDSIEFISME